MTYVTLSRVTDISNIRKETIFVAEEAKEQIHDEYDRFNFSNDSEYYYIF
jgi:hypothetical protein